MTAMDALFAVQDEDIIRGQLDYRRTHLSERQDVVTAEVERDETTTAIAGLELERLEHSRRQNRLEGEVAAIEARLAELEKKLYGSAITSAREATSLQDEIGHLRRRQDDPDGVREVARAVMRRNQPEIPEEFFEEASEVWAAKRTAVLIRPEKVVSWDHTKLDGVY
ncbi:MAG: hypothetical protein VX889_01220 [Actinomycetota bacterium]|nr:hypothetical protein [Actinomycetota bacterium]